MRLSIIGSGYVGLVTGACLAEIGHEVVCVDVDEQRVEQITQGTSPMYEPGLGELLERHAGGRLQATCDLRGAVLDTELTMIAVGTPSNGGAIDLSSVIDVSRAVGAALAEKAAYHVVVVKSTVVPGTTDGVVLPLLQEIAGKRAFTDFGVGMNPEFLTEGQAVADFMSPDRIVVGGIDERTVEALTALYDTFPASIPRVRTSPRAAEMIKYASNSLLATMISFANEIANLCAATGDVDVVDVMRGVHLSRYLTPLAADGSPVRAPIAAFLEAGCGFGGSCLPKDVRALIAEGERLGQPMRLMRAVMETNDAQPNEVLRLVEAALTDLERSHVTILGLAFKPDTDDVRESPALPIIEGLLDRGAFVTIHDPVADHVPDPVRQRGVFFCPDLETAVRDADAVVLVTRWEQFRALPRILAGLEDPPAVIDGRRMLDKDSVDRYAGIGL
jgi:UDPglucose 6-dehydrogenase